eukprot:345030-Amphidinium_carterae.1
MAVVSVALMQQLPLQLKWLHVALMQLQPGTILAQDPSGSVSFHIDWHNVMEKWCAADVAAIKKSLEMLAKVQGKKKGNWNPRSKKDRRQIRTKGPVGLPPDPRVGTVPPASFTTSRIV